VCVVECHLEYGVGPPDRPWAYPKATTSPFMATIGQIADAVRSAAVGSLQRTGCRSS
jgi:hypothetical protein